MADRSDDDRELRILLVGNTGSGKSASSNTILNNKEFLEGSHFESVTMRSQRSSRRLEKRTILVIDTPGIGNTSMTEDEVKNEIGRGIELCNPGPHVILLVIKLDGRFREEEVKAVEWFQDNFGSKAIDYMVVLFTYGDSLTESLDDRLCKCPRVKKLVYKCSSTHHVFNNKRQDEDQVTELLNKIDHMMRRNKRFYTAEMFMSAQSRPGRSQSELQKVYSELHKVEDECKRTEGDLLLSKMELKSSQTKLGETELELNKTKQELKMTKKEVKEAQCETNEAYVVGGLTGVLASLLVGGFMMLAVSNKT